MPEHLAEVKKRRLTEIDKVEHAVRDRLNREINYWDMRAARLREEERAGREQRVNAQNAEATAQRLVERLWARTVRSPDPAAKGSMVPLISSYMLSTRDEKKAWVELVIDPNSQDGWRFDIKTGTLGKKDEERLESGTKSAKGQAFTCVLTGSPIERNYIQSEGKADRLSARLMVIVADKNRRRVFLPPDQAHEKVASSINNDPIVDDARAGFLSAATPTRAMITGGVCSAYRRAAQEIIAKRIIEMAQRGEREPTVLADDAVNFLARSYA